ncbi:hypothetical protein [Aeromonas caviae]|nr:hypothetical protein [Aeromonas caviae]
MSRSKRCNQSSCYCCSLCCGSGMLDMLRRLRLSYAHELVLYI